MNKKYIPTTQNVFFVHPIFKLLLVNLIDTLSVNIY